MIIQNLLYKFIMVKIKQIKTNKQIKEKNKIKQNKTFQRMKSQIINSMNSKRKLLKVDQSKESQHKLYYQENTSIQSDDQQNYDQYVLKKTNNKQTNITTLTKESAKQIVIWIFILSVRIGKSNQQRIKQLYLYNEQTNHYQKHILPQFKQLNECKSFMRKLDKNIRRIKYKIVGDNENASNLVQQFRNNSLIQQIHIFNQQKEQGLNQLLPLKKKTSKLSIYNQISSIITKAQKQLDYKFCLVYDQLSNKAQIYLPNQFPKFKFIPSSKRHRTDVTQIENCIGIKVRDKKDYLQSFVRQLKVKFNQNQQFLDQIDKFEQLNHISLIVTKQKAINMLKTYFGLQSSIDQKIQDNQRPQFLYQIVKQSVSKNIKTQQNCLGVNQLFYCIKQFYKSTKSIQIQHNNKRTLSPIQQQRFDKSPDQLYKICTFSSQNISILLNKTIQISEFVQCYTSLQQAKTCFNKYQNLQVQSPQTNYIELIRNKVIMKIQFNKYDYRNYQHVYNDYIVDYGFVKMQELAQTLQIDLQQRWNQTVIINIMNTFKIQKVTYISIYKNITCPVLHLTYCPLKQIFDTDENYLSPYDLKVFNYYKNCQMFTILNGNYNAKKYVPIKQVSKKQVANHQLATKQIQKTNDISEIDVNKIQIRPKTNTTSLIKSDEKLKIIQLGQVIKGISSRSLTLLIQNLKDCYQQIQSKQSSNKKKSLRIDVQQKKSQYQQLIELIYSQEKQMYQIKLQLEQYSLCEVHLLNMKQILDKQECILKNIPNVRVKLILDQVGLYIRVGHIFKAQKQIEKAYQFIDTTINSYTNSQISCCSIQYICSMLCCCFLSNQNDFSYVKSFIWNKFQGSKQTQKIKNFIGFVDIFQKASNYQQKMNNFVGKHYYRQKTKNLKQLFSKNLLQLQLKLLKSQDINLLQRIYNSLSFCSTLLTDKILYYIKAINLLQAKQPYQIKQAQYYVELGDIIYQQFIVEDNKLIQKQQFIRQINHILQFYEKAIGIYQCHKYTELKIIEIVNKIVQKFIYCQKYNIALEYINKKLGELLYKKNFKYPCRSQLSISFYHLSIIHQNLGNLYLSHQYIKKSLSQLQPIPTRPKSQSTYPTSTQHFLIKLQQIKLSIKMKANQKQKFKQVDQLRLIVNDFYIKRSQNTEVMAKIYQIQMVYCRWFEFQQGYYKYALKNIVSRTKSNTQSINKQNFYIYCQLLIYFAKKQPNTASILYTKIEKLYSKIKKEIMNTNTNKTAKQLNHYSFKFWQYHLAKGIYLDSINKFEQACQQIQLSMEYLEIIYNKKQINLNNLKQTKINKNKYGIDYFSTQFKYLRVILNHLGQDIQNYNQKLQICQNLTKQMIQYQQEMNNSNNSQKDQSVQDISLIQNNYHLFQEIITQTIELLQSKFVQINNRKDHQNNYFKNRQSLKNNIQYIFSDLLDEHELRLKLKASKTYINLDHKKNNQSKLKLINQEFSFVFQQD